MSITELSAKKLLLKRFIENIYSLYEIFDYIVLNKEISFVSKF